MKRNYVGIILLMVAECFYSICLFGQDGVTVAGGNGGGLAANQLNSPNRVFVVRSGDIYVADGNARIQRWSPGASSGATVAGGNGIGAAANQLASASDVFVTSSGVIYIADGGNHRIQSWIPGGLVGTTVAGGNGQGSGTNQLSDPSGVFVDANGKIYVADKGNHRIQRFEPGASVGVTVAGGNGPGAASNQLNTPSDLFVDAGGNIYVADNANHRIQKWTAGASTGITVAGGYGQGLADRNLSFPTDVFVDPDGNMYAPDLLISSIKKWAPGALESITVAGTGVYGSGTNQLGGPSGVFLDERGNIYVADKGNNRIQKFTISDFLGSSANGIIVAGGNGFGSSANQVSPQGIFVDAKGNTYVADIANNRVQKWVPGASEGITVAGGNGYGSAPNQFAGPLDVFVDASDNVYVADELNQRIQKWAPGATTGITIAGGNGRGSASNQLYYPSRIFGDASGNIYVSENVNNRVQKWVPGASEGITVAGGNGQGAAANQLYNPSVVFVDAAGNVYVADFSNNRIQKWAPGASEGSTVAGGYGAGTAVNQLNGAIGVFVDGNRDVYIADQYNNRIQKWVQGASSGITVAGGNGRGSAPNQFDYPSDLFVDVSGNIFVADANNRVQKFGSGAGLTYKYYEGNWNSLPDFNLLTPKRTGNSSNIDIGVRRPGTNDHFAFVWEGFIKITTPGDYSFETVSDDGSKVYFNSLYDPLATATVSNDNVHAPASTVGTINIPNAGVYPISVSFFEKEGGEQLQVYWKGPGISRQLIPDSVFTQVPPSPPSKNLAFRYYEGDWNSLPDFNSLSPVKTGAAANIDLSERTPGRNDHFAFVWEGFIRIPTAGTYNFETTSDDGSRIYFNSDYNPSAAATVDNDGIHAPTSTTGSVYVNAPGIYPIAITYFEKDGGEQMQIYWSGPTFSKQLIPDSPFVEAPLIPSNGLSYKYYEGNWNKLPDFTTLAPVKTGISSNVDLTVRTPGRNDNFAFLWQGYIYISTPGTYTFETISDDGSKLYFNSFYNPINLPTVNNDGIHAPYPASQTIEIPVAGAYPINITYFEKEGEETIQLYWTGPGIARQRIPDATFTQAPMPSTGLAYKYYEGTWNALPDFDAITPVKTGSSANVDLSQRAPGRNDNFAFLWQGYIKITTPGNYTFETISDDGSKLYFNSFYNPSAIPTVSNDGLHAPNSATGTVNVPVAGRYPIAISFFEKDGGEQIQVYWTGPGIERQLVADSVFMQAVPPAPVSAFQIISASELKEEVSKDNITINRIYPNPFNNTFNIDFYNSSAGNDIYIGVYDMKGRLIYQRHPGKMNAGNSTVKIKLDGNQLPWGMYMAQLKINGVPKKIFKLIKVK